MTENEVLHQDAKNAIAFIASQMPLTDGRRQKNMVTYLIDVIYNSIRANFAD